jgi:hypothetical protein
MDWVIPPQQGVDMTKFFIVLCTCIGILSCSKDDASRTTICFSGFPKEQFEYGKEFYLSERGRSYTFIVELDKDYKSIKLPVDSQMKLRVLVGHPSRYPTERIVDNMLKNKTGRVASNTIEGLKRYIKTLVAVSNDEFDPENTDYKDIFIKNLNDSFMASCSRGSNSSVNPSCRFTYRLKSVDVSYYLSLPLLPMWSSIKEDVDRHLLAKENCPSAGVAK